MFGTKTRDLSQQELIHLVEGFQKLARAFSGLLRQVGRREIDPEDAATRLQAVTEGRAPDALVPVALQPQISSMDDDEAAAHGVSEQKRRQYTERAQRAMQQGRITKAIGHLERILKNDPRDVRTLLKIGDLHTQRGDSTAAIQTYLKVAAFYAEQGFYLKAVAVYKQILQIEEMGEVHAKLADLYHQLGLMQDAMVQYQHVAASYDRNGQTDDCMAMWRKIVELDPQNVQSRIKLAEVYAKNGLTLQATQEFEHVAKALKEQRRMDDYLKVAERLVHHDPSRADVMLELSRIYLQKGQTKRALAKLQVCFKSDPNDIEVLKLLEHAFTALKQPDRAALVREQIVRVLGKAPQADAPNVLPEQRDAPDTPAEHAVRIVDTIINDLENGDRAVPTDDMEEWDRWTAIAADGPIVDGHDDAVLQELLGHFADLAQPTFVGPVPALRGLARCADALGERGRAIEVYAALVQRFERDPNPPAWLEEARQRLLALTGEPKQ